jgi:exodeoxyribonuclease VII large subunit
MIGENPGFSVSEFVAVFNQSLEMIYPQVSITGELSSFRVSKNRWVYFDLKDEAAKVEFFGSVYNLPGPLEDGITCEVLGRPKLHPQFGFSVQVDQIRAVGEGSIKKAQDLLRRKLETEGLFTPERKRPLPYPPTRIGLITSADSAAIADFRKVAAARWPALKIELKDTLVQGASAPAAIIKAIQEFNLESAPPEVLVLIRGGGSAEDLAAFSEESVVRAVAASRLPTLVAIGHESDTSLAELAADRRASTPSNAAELLVPDISHENRVVQKNRTDLTKLLEKTFNREGDSLKVQKNLLQDSIMNIFSYHRHQLSSQAVLFRALNPLLPLQQGYALARSASGAHIKQASQLNVGDVFSLQFTDGKKQAEIRNAEQ